MLRTLRYVSLVLLLPALLLVLPVAAQKGARDGQWRKLRVRVNPPAGLTRLHVRAKEGYYGPH